MRAIAFASLIAAVGLAVGIVMTWPLLVHLRSTVLDDGSLDAFQFLWNLWWIRESLVKLHSNPFVTTHLYYPDGVPLLFHTGCFALGFATLPLQLVAGVVVAHNVLVVTAPALTLLSIALLARQATGDPWAALIAGLLGTVTPFAVWVLPVIYLSCGWIPPALLALWWTAQRVRHWALIVGTLALLGFAVFTSQEYAMVALTLLGIDVTLRLVLRRLALPLWVGGTTVFFVGAGALLGGLAAIALASPAQAPPPWQALVGSGSVAALLTPPWLATWRHPFIRVFYLGSLTATLAVPALVLAPRRAAYWVLLAAPLLLMVMGPYLHWSHRFLTSLPPGTLPEPSGVPGLYLIAGGVLPILKFLRAPYRWLAAVNPVLAVLAGIGVARLRACARHPPGRSLMTGTLLALAIMVPALEVRGLRAPLVSTAVPTAYDAVAQDPTEAALLDLPSGLVNDRLALFSSRYMFFQTAHRKPLLDGTVSRLPPGRERFFERDVDDFSRMPWLKYVVVHRDLLPRASETSYRQTQTLTALAQRQGHLVARDATTDVYQLDTFQPHTVRTPSGRHAPEGGA